jgi:hypothetical protein
MEAGSSVIIFVAVEDMIPVEKAVALAGLSSGWQESKKIVCHIYPASSSCSDQPNI